MKSERGTSDLISTMITIVIALTTALTAAVYTNNLASERMKEHGETISNIINKNSEDVIIVHAKYDADNQVCDKPLMVWVYNAGVIETSVVKVIIDESEFLLNTPLPIHDLTILCLDYSIVGDHTIIIECKYGNRSEYKVSIDG